jgi:hypothetical protein
MNHPELILRTLDSHLAAPTRLILYGRAALALGYPNPLADFHATMDVDAILPDIEMASIESDDSFWHAIERTNEELQSAGLYLTHLFADTQVILRADWLNHLVPVSLADLRLLSLYRPATEDLLLTKMMRIDPQDRSDIQFLLARLKPSKEEIEILMQSARIPDIPEIRKAFDDNAEWLLNIV